MAKLTALPSQAIIDGLKGKIDYYLWMGIPVARKWPRSPGKRRAPSVEAQWPAFSYAARMWRYLSPEVQEAWALSAKGTNLTGRDLQLKAYIGGYLKA